MCPLSLLVQLITLFQLLCHCPRLLHAMHQCITGNIHWPFFHSASLILETKERFFLLPLKALFQVSVRMPRSECVSSPSVDGPTWQLAHHALYNQLARPSNPALPHQLQLSTICYIVYTTYAGLSKAQTTRQTNNNQIKQSNGRQVQPLSRALLPEKICLNIFCTTSM